MHNIDLSPGVMDARQADFQLPNVSSCAFLTLIFPKQGKVRTPQNLLQRTHHRSKMTRHDDE